MTEQSTPEVSSKPAEVSVSDRMKLEAIRRAQWKGAVQQELQLCVQEASSFRKKIAEAKTQYKKDYYNKKFAKIQGKVLQMVAALRQLEAQEAQAKAPNAQVPVPHVHDEHCNHTEEEKQNETSEPPTTT